MNDWNNDDQLGGGPEVPEIPDAPAAPAEPAAPFAPDPVDYDMTADFGGDEKINRGNRGMVIAFLVLLVLGGVIGVKWYFDNADYQKWDAELKKALVLPDGEFEAALRQIMKSCDRNDILEQVAFELGEAKDATAVPVLTSAVAKGGQLAQEAAMALAKIGGNDAKGAADAIFDQMNKSKELMQAKFAWALCVLGDDRGFPILLEGVSKQIVTVKNIPEYNPDIIARVGTTDRLIQLASATDPMLQMYAAMELGFRSDKDPVPALLKLLKDPNDKVAEAAAVSLGRTADERAGKALLTKIKQTPALLDSILQSVTQSVGSPGLEAIYKNTSDPAIKYKIIGKLKRLRDPRSVDLLLSITDEQFPGSDDKAIREADEIRNQALWTLEDLGDKRIADKMFIKTQWEPVSEEKIPDAAIRYRQDDMSRKIANGVVSWFGEVNPDSAGKHLMQIYNENAPYSNTPESARRVKVDIGPLMDSMGRTGDTSFCRIIEPFLTAEEGFYSQAASMAMGRLKCPGTTAKFLNMMVMTNEERKEERFATLLESRDWQMEDRLQERRNSIIASRYLQDPKVSEKLMDIVLDPADDPELRKESANSLAYVADEKAMDMILEKVKNPELDTVARAALIQGLWHNPSDAATEAMMALLEGQGNTEFIKAASIVVGEAGNAAYEKRLNSLLDHQDESRQRAAVFAILLGGNLERLDRILEILDGQESRLVVREWYESHPVYLTEKIFTTQRIFKRLEIAKAIADKTAGKGDVLWPWKHLTDRLKKGWDTSPGGLSALQVRQRLSDAVRSDDKYRQLAADILAGLGERGFLLDLQAGEGKAGTVARDTLRNLNLRSQ